MSISAISVTSGSRAVQDVMSASASARSTSAAITTPADKTAADGQYLAEGAARTQVVEGRYTSAESRSSSAVQQTLTLIQSAMKS